MGGCLSKQSIIGGVCAWGRPSRAWEQRHDAPQGMACEGQLALRWGPQAARLRLELGLEESEQCSGQCWPPLMAWAALHWLCLTCGPSKMV